LRQLANPISAVLEAMLLTPDPRAEAGDAEAGGPLTRERVQRALDMFRAPEWLDEYPEPERRRREFRECQEAGLFPTELLESVLADPNLTWPIATHDIVEELTRELYGYIQS
jgi:hypothetical protein